MKIVVILLALSALSAAAQSTPTTAQMTAQEEHVWDLVKKNDLRPFGDILSPDFLAVMGGFYNRQQTIDQNAQCQLNSVKLSDMQARVLSKDSFFVAYSMYQDSTCGPKDKPAHDAGYSYVTSVWARKGEGGPWKVEAHSQTDLRPAK